jgi:hypothetical protein
VSIAGKERPLIDVFPLCLKHHKEAHAPRTGCGTNRIQR